MRAAHIECQLEALQSMADREPGMQAMVELMRARFESAEFYPELSGLRSLRTSPEGTIWVSRSGGEPGSPGPIDLITPGGRYLASYAQDAPVCRPRSVRTDWSLSWRQTNLDVQTVVVKRLPPEVR